MESTSSNKAIQRFINTSSESDSDFSNIGSPERTHPNFNSSSETDQSESSIVLSVTMGYIAEVASAPNQAVLPGQATAANQIPGLVVVPINEGAANDLPDSQAVLNHHEQSREQPSARQTVSERFDEIIAKYKPFTLHNHGPANDIYQSFNDIPTVDEEGIKERRAEFEEAMDLMRKQLQKHNSCSQMLLEKIEVQFSSHFWTMHDLSFYYKELKHFNNCDQSERVESFGNGQQRDKLHDMSALCEETLNSMDILYDIMTIRSEDMKRLGKVPAQVIKEQTEKIRTLNKCNNYLFSRCDEKRFAEDFSSDISNQETIDLIKHIIMFGSKVHPDMVPSLPQIFINPQQGEKLQLKDISYGSFYRIRDLLSKKVHPLANDIPNLVYPYLSTRNLTYSQEELDTINDILEHDRIALIKRNLFNNANTNPIVNVDLVDEPMEMD